MNHSATPSTPEIRYLCLTSNAQVVKELEQCLIGLGFEPIAEQADSLEQLATAARARSAAFAFTHLPQAKDITSPPFGLRFGAVRFPPIVVAVDGIPTADEIETLRFHGVSHIMPRPFSAKQEGAVLRALSAAPSWQGSETEPASVPDVVHALSAEGATAMIAVADSSTTPAQETSWTELAATQDPTAGTQGRLYLKDGALVHAETPMARGASAVTQLLRIPKPLVHVHEAFLMPRPANIETAISGGAVVDSDSSTSVETKTGTVEYTDEQENEKAGGDENGEDDMTTLSSLTTVAPDLWGAAIADRRGHVREVSGNTDGETICAVAAMSCSHMQQASDMMGLGEVRGWLIVSGESTLYTHVTADGFVVARGAKRKNPDTVFKAIREKL